MLLANIAFTPVGSIPPHISSDMSQNSWPAIVRLSVNLVVTILISLVTVGEPEQELRKRTGTGRSQQKTEMLATIE